MKSSMRLSRKPKSTEVIIDKKTGKPIVDPKTGKPAKAVIRS